MLRRGAGIFDPTRPFVKPRKRRELIGHLVKMPAPTIEKVARNLTRQAQHRGVMPKAVSRPAPAFSTPGSRHDHADRGAAAGARRAESHVAASLLVPRADHPQARLRAMQRIKEAVDLRPRQAEHRVDAMDEQ